MTLKELATELYRKSNGHFNGYKGVSIRWLMAYIQAMTRTETGRAVVTMKRISRNGDSYGYEFSDSFR